MKSLQHSSRIRAASLMGKELYRVEDDRGFIVVTQCGDKRILGFDSELEQSCVLMTKPYYLAHEYTQVMLLGLVLVDARHISLLGLGGGGLVHCLSYYYPQISLQVVELRQAVIDVAYDWFNLPQAPQLQVTTADAMAYLAELKSASSDIIFSDLYEANAMSEYQAQQEYIKASYRVLSQQGCLVINYHSMPENDTPVMQCIRQLFSEIYLCEVANGNRIVFFVRVPSYFPMMV